MMDMQTKSLWSHILGEAMKGRLKGKLLTPILSDMVTWDAWKQAHPETTVLAMPRTRHKAYTKEFYRDPSRFVVGFVGNRGMHHCSFATLNEHPLSNADAGGLPLLISFDSQSTSVRIFARKLDDLVLTFVTNGPTIRDEQTSSTWDRVSGVAIDGPLKGRSLPAHVGVVSFAKVWSTFHPQSRAVR